MADCEDVRTVRDQLLQHYTRDVREICRMLESTPNEDTNYDSITYRIDSMKTFLPDVKG